jgi:hypothetical protein
MITRGGQAVKEILAIVLFVVAGFAQPRTINYSTLKATVVRTQTLPKPNGESAAVVTIATYYRDADGRTRVEQGNSVVISDPVARTTITLDLASATARVREAGPAVQPNPSAQPSLSGPAAGNAGATAPIRQVTVTGTSEPVRPLGVTYVSGFSASGFRGEAVFPAAGDRKVPTRHVSETWRSDELLLHIKTTNTESAVKPEGDEIIRQSVEEYKDIVKGAAVDPALFSIPAGFKVTNPAASAGKP